jgi:two-component system chemotaxis response regulator CheB
MSIRSVVAVGASAGGVEALRAFVAGLSPGLPAAVLVVLHVPRDSRSALPQILTRSGPLPAAHALDGEPLQPGQISVAPVDHHMLVLEGRIRLSRGPAENGHRPAIDPLFRSAARALGPRVIAVVLSGARDDGTAGMASVVARGGVGLVQDPEDALHDSMPRSALEHVAVEHALPAIHLGKAVSDLVFERDPAEHGSGVNPLLDAETAMANMDDVTTDETGARPSGLACPACHGALFELAGAPEPRYRCRVGHAWSPESLLSEQAEALEGALWMALRALEEKGALSQRMAQAARSRGSHSTARRLEVASTDADQASDLIRDLIPRLANLTEAKDGGARGVP